MRNRLDFSLFLSLLVFQCFMDLCVIYMYMVFFFFNFILFLFFYIFLFSTVFLDVVLAFICQGSASLFFSLNSSDSFVFMIL